VAPADTYSTGQWKLLCSKSISVVPWLMLVL